MSDLPSTVPLGPTGLCISSLGIGAWAWGDRLFWGFGRNYQEADVQAAYNASREAGINFFDTAEAYGQGYSEKLLGKFTRSEADGKPPVIIATKFMPYPWRLSRKSLIKALRGSLKRLGISQVDLYQVHFPLPPLSVETWAEALADVVEEGLTQAVGISNFNEEQMRRAQLVLQRRGFSLASNQVEYSLLNRRVEINGLLQVCKELNVTLIAYSPLAQGALTGKYTPENPPPGIRGRRYNRSLLTNLQPLIKKMREIGRAHEGKTPTQIALNWLLCKGAVPIPGAKNAQQVQDIVGALGWQLSEAELAALDKASESLQ
jgi:aryl-alcohol dehydrogenase-like predicted oxidoreductase